MRPFRTEEMEMAWLTQDQIALLLSECRKHDRPDLETVVKICLATGARWSEAEGMKKASSRSIKSPTPTPKAEKTAPFRSAKRCMSLCPTTEMAAYLATATARFAQRWKERASSCRRDS